MKDHASTLPSPFDGLQMHTGWFPGVIGWVAAEHGRYYARHWGLGAVFEAKVASALAELVQRYNPETDLLLTLTEHDRIVASITVDGGHDSVAQDGARIRFVIAAEQMQGHGIGRLLVGQAMGFITESGFDRAWLTTFKGLDAARRLYEQAGFALTEQCEDLTWGVRLTEQRFDWKRTD